MDIIRMEFIDLEKCVDIIMKSELGARYYPTKEILYQQLKKGMQAGDKIYVAKDSDEDIKGIVWYQQEGMFHVFPYLHMIVVKSNCQRQGIGRKLLDFYEYDALTTGYNRLRTKVFLTVGDFNTDAERIYLNRGYVQVGQIDNLYRKRTTEKIYMKIVMAREFETYSDKNCNEKENTTNE